MKNKLRNYYNVLFYLTSQEKFKATFLIAIIIALYGSLVLGRETDSVFDIILTAFQFPIFNIFFFSLVLFHTFYICSIFEREFGSYLMRFKTKKAALKEIIIYSILINLVYFMIIIFLFLSFCLLLKSNSFAIHDYQNYNIPNVWYMLFYFFRYLMIIFLFSSILVMVYQIRKILVIVVSSCFLVGFLLYPVTGIIKSWYYIVPWNYFTVSFYSSFVTEVASSFLFLILLQMIYLLLHFLKFYKWGDS